ncbi:MAG: MATE family efflux transporter [Bacteroides sp.]|nr:MATE family efflux transporter [Roseburia sp.]MCM1345564.1 MATE family efflux transporter [Bacteroides sp.]MCM1420778.1 MATE family efflux transporter [Bacteroides sp.]
MTKDMTTGNPFRLILNFAMPLLLGSLLQQTYSMIDAAIVGRYLGMNALAGVGASTSVTFLILGFCNGCTGGFGIPIAQAFGAKNYTRMRSYIYNSYWVGGSLSIILTVATSLLCASILTWMQTPYSIFSDAYNYLLITFIGIPFSLSYNLLASIIRALGDSKTPFYFLLIASVLNVIFDLAFIITFGWGTAGAAIATVASQGISVILCLWYMRSHFPILKESDLAGFKERISWRNIKTLLGMGIPMGLQFSITAIGSIMLQSANNALGTVCITAFTASMRIKMFFICPFENLGIAMATYCGQNLGAKQIDRIRTGIKSAMGMTTCYTVFTMIVLLLFSRRLSTLFIYSSETAILDKSEQFMHISCLFYIFLGTLCVFRYSLQGVGFTNLSMMSGVFEMIARITISLIIVPLLGFVGVAIGDPAAWIAADMFLLPAMWKVYRHLKRKYCGQN